MGTRAAVAAALTTLLLAGLPGTAGAHKAKLGSIVEIDAYLTVEKAFIGGVGSFDSKACKRNRLVALWRINPGAMTAPFGTTRTDRTGDWRIDANAPAGTYFATVKKKTIRRSSEHRHVCKGDQSSNFIVG
jgi:hypothetical protein